MFTPSANTHDTTAEGSGGGGSEETRYCKLKRNHNRSFLSTVNSPMRTTHGVVYSKAERAVRSSKKGHSSNMPCARRRTASISHKQIAVHIVASLPE